MSSPNDKLAAKVLGIGYWSPRVHGSFQQGTGSYSSLPAQPGFNDIAWAPLEAYQVRLTWAEIQYQTTTGVTIPFGIGVAEGAGKVFALQQGILFNTGQATAEGKVVTISGNSVLSFVIGQAKAEGKTASLTSYEVRITWAELQYQYNTNTVLGLNIGAAVANGGASIVSGVYLNMNKGSAVASAPDVFSVDITIACEKGTAGARGSLFSMGGLIPFNKGQAVGAGKTISLSDYSVRVTWAEIQYFTEEAPPVIISFNKGQAVGSAPSIFSVDVSVVSSTGLGRARGLSSSIIASGSSIIGLNTGRARGAGQQAEIRTSAVSLTFSTARARGNGKKAMVIGAFDPLAYMGARTTIRSGSQGGGLQKKAYSKSRFRQENMKWPSRG